MPERIENSFCIGWTNPPKSLTLVSNIPITGKRRQVWQTGAGNGHLDPERTDYNGFGGGLELELELERELILERELELELELAHK